MILRKGEFAGLHPRIAARLAQEQLSLDEGHSPASRKNRRERGSYRWPPHKGKRSTR